MNNDSSHLRVRKLTALPRINTVTIIIWRIRLFCPVQIEHVVPIRDFGVAATSRPVCRERSVHELGLTLALCKKDISLGEGRTLEQRTQYKHRELCPS